MVKKQILFLSIIVFILSGCFEEEKPKQTVKKQKNPTNYMVEKVKNTDSNKSLSQTVQDDGIVIDGARDEKLLNDFGLAVSQVIVEEGVSVPDCTSLSKTGFLTKEECDEISEKYFGFYEIDMLTGEATKINDLFQTTIQGKGIDIRDSEVELFDSSGNPLLNNVVEFEEFVDSSDDLELLKNIAQKLPSDKSEQKEKLENRIDFLEDVEREKEQSNNSGSDDKKKDETPQSNGGSTPNNPDTNDENNANNQELEEIRAKISSLNSALSSYQSGLAAAERKLENDSNNPTLQQTYNELLSKISETEAELSYYQSMLN